MKKPIARKSSGDIARGAEKTNPAKRPRKPLTLWRTVLYILAGAAVLGVLVSIIVFFMDPEPKAASAQLQLTFDGAAEGIAPDGRRFDIGEILSDDVIAEALRESGLDGRYSVDQIRKSLVVAGAYPEDIVGQTMSYESLLDFTTNRTLTTSRFNPTLFHVTLYDHFDTKIAKSELESLLKNILSVYKNNFSEMYTQGTPSKKAFTLDVYDYPQQLEILQQQLEILSRYAEEMYEKEPTFRYYGNGFNDILVRLNALRDSDIGRLNANLTLNALTKDPGRLLTQYNFELLDLGNRLLKRRGQLSRLDTLVDSYEKSEILYISTQESLTKIDGNSTETYDALVDIRRMVAEDNTQLSSQIATYRLKLADLTGEMPESIDGTDPGTSDGSENTEGDGSENTDDGEQEASGAATAGQSAEGAKNTPQTTVDTETSAAQREALEAEIAELEKKSMAVIQDFSDMLQAWNVQKVNDSTVSISNYRYASKKLISGAFVKKTIMTAGPIFALAMIVCLCMIIAAKSRELKIAEKAD